MKSRLLITTADKRTWKDDQPVLFLGEWCRLYNCKKDWDALDAEVAPYHWNDREKLYRDFLYLRELYEELLADLAAALNNHHGTNHSLRYWRILTGPWLSYFVEILFDRWEMIQYAIQHYDISSTIVLEIPPDELIPTDMDKFVNYFVDDLWNHAIYGIILKDWTSIECETSPLEPQQLDDRPTANPNRLGLKSQIRRLVTRRLVTNSISGMSPLLSRRHDALFVSSYMPRKEQWKLQLSLGQLPTSWRREPSPQIPANLEARKTITLPKTNNSQFESFARELIPYQIPTAYLEGYKAVENKVSKLGWPKQPKFVMTAVSHIADEVFKCYAANLVERGCPLVIMVHGGGGKLAYSSFQEIDIDASDLYLTWGWDYDNPKVVPTVISKTIGKQRSVQNPQGGILLITYSLVRYSFSLGAQPTYDQWLSGYQPEQFRFVKALPEHLQHQVSVRLYRDYGNSQEARWQDNCPQVTIAPFSLPYETLLRENRLIVATYNATTFVETISLDIPTIVFWNPKHWELQPSAQPYFDRLKAVGIFHETPESAASKLAEVWDDVPGWWHQPDVQEALEYFRHRFARTVENPIQVLKEALSTVASWTVGTGT